MKIVSVLIIAIVALLSIAAGLAKVMQAPQEMEFLQSVGLSTVLIFVGGDLTFGLFSIFPIVLAAVIIYQASKAA